MMMLVEVGVNASAMRELSLLENFAEDVAKLVYRSYLIYDENELLSMEIDRRLIAIARLICGRIFILENAYCRKLSRERIGVERALVKQRKHPRVDYSKLRAARSHGDASLADISEFIPFGRQH